MVGLSSQNEDYKGTVLYFSLKTTLRYRCVLIVSSNYYSDSRLSLDIDRHPYLTSDLFV